MKCHVLAVLLVVLAVAAGLSAAAAEDGDRKFTTVERQVIAEGAAWGAINTLNDGSLGLIYQKARPIKECKGCNIAMEWVRSIDGGKTWSKPVLVSERRGPNGELYLNGPDGGYIALQDRNEAFAQLPSGRIVVAFARLNYSYKKTGEQVVHADTDFGFENQGVWYCWSDDKGKTWSKPLAMDTSIISKKAISPHWRIINLSDGTALMSVYGMYNQDYKGSIKVPDGTQKLVAVFRSKDNGKTWGDPSVIMTATDKLIYEETALCLLNIGALLAHVRTPSGRVDQYASTDKGRTWQKVGALTQDGQQPGGAFQLKSGRLMATWGNRRNPCGAMAMVTDNSGNWGYDHRVSLAWDAPNENCGYANGAQAKDGSIVVTYYIMHHPGGQDAEGYHNLWLGSKVYVVRFTEQEFLKEAGL